MEFSQPVVIALFIVLIIICLILLIALSSIFSKLGKGGWKAFVPVYNLIVLLQIGNLPLWNLLVFCVPVVNLYVFYKVWKVIGQHFGKSTAFIFGMTFLPFIFLPILAFGNTSYNNVSMQAPVMMFGSQSNPISNQPPMMNPSMEIMNSGMVNDNFANNDKMAALLAPNNGALGESMNMGMNANGNVMMNPTNSMMQAPVMENMNPPMMGMESNNGMMNMNPMNNGMVPSNNTMMQPPMMENMNPPMMGMEPNNGMMNMNPMNNGMVPPNNTMMQPPMMNPSLATAAPGKKICPYCGYQVDINVSTCFLCGNHI